MAVAFAGGDRVISSAVPYHGAGGQIDRLVDEFFGLP